MNKRLKKIILFVLISMLAVSPFTTYAANNNNKPLHEKYSYNENFEYDDTFIAHALKSSVVLILLQYEASIDYQPVTFDKQTVIDYFNELYARHSANYSKEQIAEVLVKDMSSNLAGYLEWGTSKEVPVTAAWQGSGVIIDESGYIATNSHVASLSEDSKLQQCVQQLQTGILDDLKNVVTEVNKLGVSLNEEQVKALFETVVKETAEKATIKNEKQELYVCFASADGKTNVENDRAYPATVVNEGVSLEISNDGVTQDGAIIKINETGLIALKLSDSYPDINSKIVSAGFPVAADSVFVSAGSDESTLSITVGTGNITRLTPIKGHNYKAIGISTTISGGNSGGPSVDGKLNIEGLNTYAPTSDNRYGYMVPSEYIRELSKSIPLTQGEVTLAFLTGLQMLQQNYGGAALECFNFVKSRNAKTPYIDELIKTASSAPNTYPKGTEPSGEFTWKIIIIIGGAVLAIVLIVILILVIKGSGKKNRNTNYQSNNGFGNSSDPFGQSSDPFSSRGSNDPFASSRGNNGFGSSNNNNDIWK